jgi:beta-mannosidase
MTREDIFGDDLYMWNYHTKNNPGLQTSVFDTMQIFAKSLLGEFKDGADRYFKYRYLQYEWVRVTLEQLRREAWFSSGMIYWMLNDCWPAASGWSIIDFYNLPKDAYYAFKRCSGKLVLSFDKTEGAISLYASAKGEEISGATVTVYKLKDGAHEKIYEGECEAIPDGSRVIYTYGDELSDGEVLIADIEANGICDRTFYKNGSLKIKPAAARLTVNKKERTVTVSSDEYIHAIELSSDAIFSDNCFSLLPGEERTVSYTENTDGDIKLTAYTLEF